MIKVIIYVYYARLELRLIAYYKSSIQTRIMEAVFKVGAPCNVALLMTLLLTARQTCYSKQRW
jgi:uncharacterized membrane protein (DUF485 family)